MHGQRRERHRRQERVDREHREHHVHDRARHVARRVDRLLRHVRDRLDAGVGNHRHRDRDHEVVPAGRDAEVDVGLQHVRREHRDQADRDQQRLRAQVGQRQEDVEAGRLLHAHDVQRHQQQHYDRAAVDVVGVGVQVPARPELGQVVRHEDRRDRDRDGVVQHLRPAGEERDRLVEGVPRERRRAAGLGEPGGGLRVGDGREEEDGARDEERDRGQAQRVGGDQAQRVVDRRPDVAVGRREQRRRPEDSVQTPGLAALHGHRAVIQRAAVWLQPDRAHGSARSGRWSRRRCRRAATS